MDRLEASFTVLNQWAQGHWQDAINGYFKLEKLDSPALRAGSKFHTEWETEIRRTGKTPEIFGAKSLTKPEVELFMSAELAPWLVLRGKIDCIDGETLYEWKTGMTESQIIANSPQVGVYGLLAVMNDRKVTTAEIHHYNQHAKSVDMSIVHLTAQRITDAASWVETIASDMHNYLVENKLYAEYNHNRRSHGSYQRS